MRFELRESGFGPGLEPGFTAATWNQVSIELRILGLSSETSWCSA